MDVGRRQPNISRPVACGQHCVHRACSLAIPNAYTWAEEASNNPSFLYDLAALPEVLSCRIYLERAVFPLLPHSGNRSKAAEVPLQRELAADVCVVGHKWTLWFSSGPLSSNSRWAKRDLPCRSLSWTQPSSSGIYTGPGFLCNSLESSPNLQKMLSLLRTL